MTPVKRAALAEYKKIPSERNLQILRATMNKVKQTARRCANEYWTQLSEDIQITATTGNIRGMYDGIKNALGPVQSKTAPSLKSATGDIITDKCQQKERLAEHYSDLHSRQNTVSPRPLTPSPACQLWTTSTLGQPWTTSTLSQPWTTSTLSQPWTSSTLSQPWTISTLSQPLTSSEKPLTSWLQERHLEVM
ncbi:hypothetical protein ACOMHN_039891 [Nucella lapillus]